MILDCDLAIRFSLGKGYVVYDTESGNVIAHDERDEFGFAWMRAAQKLARTIDQIERTAYECHPNLHVQEEDDLR